MAKPKQKAVKTPKKRSTKYGKLAAVCTKELSAKKAALVRAEKAFAKAQRTHTELLAEVARLDMLDRSLKALINGTEPPQNVRYVYTYPQWVWYGNPYGWYWNGNNYSVNLGSQNGYNFQGGQFTNVVTNPSINTINTTIGDAPVITTTAGALMSDASSGTIYTTATSGNMTMCNNANLGNFSLTSGSGGLSSTSFTTTNSPSAELTVDLSTGAEEDPLTHEEAEEVVIG